jgi:hypothetical protein
MKDAHVPLHTLGGLAELRFPELALSAYLPADPGAGRAYYRAVLAELVTADRHKLAAAERSALDRELPAVVAALEKRRFACPAVAVFSCRPRGLLRIWRMAEPVPGRIAIGEELDLAPIRLELFERPPALVVAVDKHRARLYALAGAELAEIARVEGRPIRRHHQGGGFGGESAAALQRREDEHARANAADVAAAAAELVHRDGYRRLILAGPEEARARLKQQLPASALSLLVAEGPLALDAAGSELTERLRRLDREVAHR